MCAGGFWGSLVRKQNGSGYSVVEVCVGWTKITSRIVGGQAALLEPGPGRSVSTEEEVTPVEDSPHQQHDGLVMPSKYSVFNGRQSQEGPHPNEVSRTITQFINHRTTTRPPR
uniref:Uncharacterized protein n=1 Tax=Knipowitschia caucasica TaxID=637954 RepID=A0AAV2JX18_KNICA